MKYEDKIKHFKNHLVDNGQKKNSRAPLNHWLLRKFGKEPIPPLFRPFRVNFIDLGANFGVTWGILMHFMVWRTQESHTPFSGIITSVIAGLLFGFFMASYYRKINTDLGLPEWSNYPEESE